MSEHIPLSGMATYSGGIGFILHICVRIVFSHQDSPNFTCLSPTGVEGGVRTGMVTVTVMHTSNCVTVGARAGFLATT